MADQEQLELLKQGVADWNAWRTQHPEISPDLSGANRSSGANLSEANLSGANLSGAKLDWADLSGANLREADLGRADLGGANLSEADLSGANLSGTYLLRASLRRANLIKANLFTAYLYGADLTEANFSEADLTEANLSRANFSGAKLSAACLDEAVLVETNLSRADLTGCSIYGISAWNLNLEKSEQRDLIITPKEEPIIRVDNLEVAQFLYLLLKNEKLREVIDTITAKAVLILGRFTPERKAVLDGLREALRSHGYVPILFDFEKPASRDLTETISTLAHMVRFIIADLTDAKSIPQELQRIVPDLPSVPVQPLLAGSDREYAMFEHFRRYPWVLPVYRYRSQAELLGSLEEHVIAPAEAKAREQAPPPR